MLAEGKYTATAVEHSQVTLHEKTGNEEIRVLCEILDEGDAKGVTRTWHGYFTEKTAERTIESLRYMGWKGDDITNISLEPGTKFQIVIKHEEYEGKTQEKIAWINRLQSVYVGQPMDASRKSSFASRMKGLVLASKQPGSPSPNSKGPAANEDFPFGANEPPRRASGVKL